MSNKNILIGGAWPYANSSLHLGHIAGLISGDILARYHRLKGDNVMYVSGSDCHGTPITERAKKEGKSPRDICSFYDNEFRQVFEKLQFSYDLFSKTDTEYHKEKVKEIFKKIYDNGYIYEKIEPQSFCEKCNKFLSDREVLITCPECGEESKGDQCDKCLHVPTAQELIGGTCLECGSKTIQKDNKILYLALSKLDINKFFNASGLVYKELNLKEKLNDLSLSSKLDLLSNNGMLIKRPILVGEDFVLIGFKINEWEEKLCQN